MGEPQVALRAASMVREEFGGTELSIQHEVASSAIAAQMQALVQARYAMAIRYRRDWDMVRDRLLKECKRPGFAAAAIYHKPVGGGIEGLSIRFAEAAIRCMTNVAPEVFTVYDDTEKRVVRVCVTDIEANVPYSRDIVVDKTVERKVVKEGQTVLRARQNSVGQMTYLVSATEDDLLNKENALVSKALRTLALRILPGDIKEECEAALRRIRKDKAAQDPEGEKKQILDAFSALGVNPEMIANFLGHVLDSILPAELVELRAVYQGIREGEATWKDVMALREEQRTKDSAQAGKGAEQSQPSVGTQKLKDRITKKQQQQAAGKNPPGVVPTQTAAAPAPAAQQQPAATTPAAPVPEPAPAGKTEEELEMDRNLAQQLAREAEEEARRAGQPADDGWGDE